MDYEDTSRILNQMWEQDHAMFVLWLQENQPKILEYMIEERE